MLIGGSNGSTVGALKLMRVITFLKGYIKACVRYGLLRVVFLQ